MSLAYFKKFGNKTVTDDDRPKVARFCEADYSKSVSLTTQAPADEVDINKIVARIKKGQTVMASNAEPFYGDVSFLGGLQEAIIKVQEADDLFMQFPAELRERFENDPVKFVEFLEDPKNLDEARSLGLVKPVPEPVKEAAPAPATPPTQLPS